MRVAAAATSRRGSIVGARRPLSFAAVVECGLVGGHAERGRAAAALGGFGAGDDRGQRTAVLGRRLVLGLRRRPWVRSSATTTGLAGRRLGLRLGLHRLRLWRAARRRSSARPSGVTFGRDVVPRSAAMMPSIELGLAAGGGAAVPSWRVRCGLRGSSRARHGSSLSPCSELGDDGFAGLLLDLADAVFELQAMRGDVAGRERRLDGAKLADERRARLLIDRATGRPVVLGQGLQPPCATALCSPPLGTGTRA